MLPTYWFTKGRRIAAVAAIMLGASVAGLAASAPARHANRPRANAPEARSDDSHAHVADRTVKKSSSENPTRGGATRSTSLTSATIEIAPVERLERRLCVSASAGPDAAMECGDLRIAHALPATRSRNRERAPVLTYDSRSADAVVRVPATVTLSGALPATLTATLLFGNTSVAAGSWNGSDWSAGARMITPTASLGGFPTGAYAYTLVLSGDGQQLGSANGTLFLVNRSASPMGAGWSLAGVEQLIPQGGNWTWVGGDGSAHLYSPVISNEVWAAPAVDRPDTLKRVNGVLTRLLKGGIKVQFDEQGYHWRTIRPSGDTTWFAYSSGRLDSITLPSPAPAPVYRFDYVGGYLAQVTAPGGRVTRVERTGSRVDAIVDPGELRVAFTYQPQGWRMNARTDRRGTTTTFGYSNAATLANSATPTGTGQTVQMLFAAAEGMGAPFTANAPSSSQGRHTVLNGPRRDTTVTTIWVDAFGAPAVVRNALLQQTTLVRAHPVFPALVTEIQRPSGFNTTATYDARGNPSVVTDVNPLGNGVNATTTYEWDLLHDAATRIVTPEGVETRSYYHPVTGNRLWQEDGRGTHTRVNFGYNAAQQLDSVRAPGASASTRFGYDSRGNLQSVTTPTGAVTTYVNDSAGRVRTVTTPLTLGYASGSRIDSLIYDQAGRLDTTVSIGPGASYTVGPISGVSRSLRLVVHTGYDAEDNVLSVERSSFPTAPYTSTAVTTSYTYDLLNRKRTETAHGFTQQWDYDPAGNVTRTVSRRQHVLTMAYDALNRVVSRTSGAVIYPVERCHGCVSNYMNVAPPRFPYFGQLGKFGALDTNVTIYNDVATFSYDPYTGGMRTADNRDARVHRTYYPNGALKTDSAWIAVYNRWETPGDPYSRHLYVLDYQYDRDGRRVRMQGGAAVSGIDQRYAYGAGAGLLDSIADAAAGIRFLYDAAGRQTERRVNGTAASEVRAYDDDDRVTTRWDYAGNASVFVDQLTYDERGKRTRVITQGVYPDDVQTAYDGIGTLVAMSRVRSSAAWTDEYQVDAMGSVLRTDANRGEENRRGTLHDFVGDRLSMNTALTGADVGHTSGWPAVTKVQDQSFSYDSSGNQRTGTVKAREYVPYSNPVTFQEVLQGSSWSRSFYGPDEKLRVFQRTGMEASGMRTTFVEHRYDALGRRVLTRTQRDSTCSSLPPACLSTIDRFVWDGDQLLAEHRLEAPPSTNGEALEVESSYGTLSGGGSTANFLGRIRYTHGPGIDAPLVVWQSGEALVPHANINGGYEAGSTLTGSMISMYWPSRDQTAYYAPDVRAPRTSPTHWVGSLMDAQADASGLMYRRNRYYDPASGRFTQPDPIGLAGGVNLYGYADGDPVNFSDPLGLFPLVIDFPRSWGELKEQARDWFRHVRRNWHRLVDIDNPAEPREPEAKDIDLTPPPAEERPVRGPAPGQVGPDGKRRLPGNEGSPGPEIRYDFRLPHQILWDIWNSPMPAGWPVPPKPGVLPPLPGFPRVPVIF